MRRFEVFAGPVCIGVSDLESGDPPIGVASGRFWPTSAYRVIQPSVVAAQEASQNQISLSIRIAGGQEISSVGGVHIFDFSAALGESEIQVEILGIDYPLYEEIFPNHVAAYQDRFKA